MKTMRRTAPALLALFVAAIVAKTGSAQVAAAEARPAAGKAVLLAPERLRQGDPLLVWALGDSALEGAEASLVAADGRRLAAAAAFVGPEQAMPPRSADDPAYRAYGFLMAVPFDLAPGSYRVAIRWPEAAGPLELSAALSVAARDFPKEDIGLDAANSKLRAEPDPRKEEEARRLAELLGRADADAVYLDGSSFMMPIVPRRKSAGFGDKRRYLYAGGGSEAAVHAGLDLAVASGTPVDACGPGRVVMAADRIVTGKTVVVEHVPGLFSLYMHLSSISVAEGQVVERGASLGLSGSTGLSTGPHLHWEVRAAGQAVDPEYWLSRPPLDKDRAAAIIASLIEGR